MCVSACACDIFDYDDIDDFHYLHDTSSMLMMMAACFRDFDAAVEYFADDDEGESPISRTLPICWPTPPRLTERSPRRARVLVY